MIAVTPRHFEHLVRLAVRNLPPPFRDRLENLDVTVERRPSRRQLRQAGVPPGHTLLGLYQGIPHTHRGMAYNFTLPDRIIIFQEPIEERCDSDEELVASVRHTVLHEIAHHFGISDARLAELDRY